MQIVHILRASPKCEFAVMAELGQTCMLFQSKVSAAFIEGDVFSNVVGLGKAGLHTAGKAANGDPRQRAYLSSHQSSMRQPL